MLTRVLELGRELTGAKYAALGVLNPDRSRLERFITSGMDPELEESMGEAPHGLGVLGHLIDHPGMLRLDDLTKHPSFYGYSDGHPEMTSFLGLPIMIREEVWGNLYLAEKEGGFDRADEGSVQILASWAAIAIENARLYNEADRHGLELEQAVSRLEASAEIAALAGGANNLAVILEIICERAISLAAAKTLMILLIEGGTRLEMGALAGEPMRGGLIDLDSGNTIVTQAIAAARPMRFSGVSGDLRMGEAGGEDSALVIPLEFRGKVLGALVAIDPPGRDDELMDEDDLLLQSFASTTATAIASARSIAEDRLRESMNAAEQERGRWSRELHDDTLQNLGGIRLLLSAARRDIAGEGAGELLEDVNERVDETIASLRRLIADLRPAELDEIGLGAALLSLTERFEAENGVPVSLRVELDFERGASETRLSPALEDSVYRMAQEAMTNVAKHASASGVDVEVVESAGWVRLTVSDDGVGFDPTVHTGGLGVIGMRERAALVGGSLEITSASGSGATLAFGLPARHR